MKTNFNVRLEIVKRVLEAGETKASVSSLYGINVNTISRWIRRYRLHGDRGLVPRSMKSIPVEEIIEACRMVIEKSIPLYKVSANLNITESALRYNINYIMRHNNDCESIRFMKTRKVKPPTKTELKNASKIQALIEENERLKAELADKELELLFIKKYQALIQEEENNLR